MLDFSFYLSPHFTVFFLSFLSMYSDNFDSVTNNLRNSANGSFVTSEDTFPLTGYEPNDTELINDTELNDSVLSKFTDFQDPLVHFTPSSDQDMDDETLGKLLAEVHRDYADYRRPEGVSVSPSSMSVMVDRTGKPVEKSDIDQFCFSVRNMYSAHNSFPAITQTERMVDRTGKRGNLWKKSLELLRSVKALVRRLGLCSMNKDERSSQNVARKFLVTNCTQLEQNKNAKFYKKNYASATGFS